MAIPQRRDSAIADCLQPLRAHVGRETVDTEAEKLVADIKAQAEKAGSTVEQNRWARNELFNALYVPNGYDKAIEIGTALLKTDQAANGDLHFWLACAYGQRAATLRRRGADFAAEKATALGNLRTMKEVRPDLLPSARSVWQPDTYQGKQGRERPRGVS
jgi:hypothetical protein